MNKEKQQRLFRLLSGGLFLFLGMLISILNVLPDLDPTSVLYALTWVLLGLGILMEISALGITGAAIHLCILSDTKLQTVMTFFHILLLFH